MGNDIWNICYGCGGDVHEDDTVWIDPSNGRATTSGESFHVKCAPPECDECYSQGLPSGRPCGTCNRTSGLSFEDALSTVNTIGHLEGWGIFVYPGRRLVLDALDDAGIFNDESEAHDHIERLAAEGSKLHVLALQLLS